jgi:hypothetical protein
VELAVAVVLGTAFTNLISAVTSVSAQARAASGISSRGSLIGIARISNGAQAAAPTSCREQHAVMHRKLPGAQQLPQSHTV